MSKLVLAVLAILTFFSANAYRIEWGRNVVISQPVHEDLYVAGGTVTINAPVYGDLIVAGGTIYLNDTVTNDLLLAGGTVHINGYVADDIRCAGDELYVQKSIGDDLVIAGGKINIAKEAMIGGGLITGSGEVVLNGQVNGNIKAEGAKFVFNGTANKDFNFRGVNLTMNGVVMGNAAIAANSIKIGNYAVFHEGVRYWNRKGELDFKRSLHGSEAAYDRTLQITPDEWYYLGHSTIIGLLWYLSTVLVFLILIQYLFRNTFRRAADSLDQSLLKSMGYGFLFFISVPIAVAILLITVVGIPVGIILMFSYIVLLLLATVIASLVFAKRYNHRFEKSWSFWQIVFAALAMFILFKLVTFTPFFGWLIMIIVACIAFGALVRNINWKRRQQVAMPG